MSAAPVPADYAVMRRMQRQRTASTGPELRLRSALAALGWVGLPGMALPVPRRRCDAGFPSLAAAVFVDGCFWHGCPEHSRPVGHNGGWWAAKRLRTAERDADTDRRLLALGWAPLRVWEHEDPAAAALRISGVLRERA